jgi:S1-C subfamily serine protease
MVTASHVVYDPTWYAERGQFHVRVTPKKNLAATLLDGKTYPIDLGGHSTLDDANAEFDLAAVQTSIHNECFISISPQFSADVGQHLISIGFPGLNPEGVLYEGFLSSAHARFQAPVGVVGNQQITANFDVFRVQMPITPGASGAPVLDDADNAIAVVTAVPVLLTQNIERVIGTLKAQQGVTMSLGRINVVQTLAELAWVVKEFETPGAGYAVPLRYILVPGGK